MVIERECRTFVPSIPVQGTAGVWFQDDTFVKTEDQLALPANNDTEGTVVDPGITPNRIHPLIVFLLAGVGNEGGQGWAADAVISVGCLRQASDGVVEDAALEEGATDAGDGIFSTQAMESSGPQTSALLISNTSLTELGDACTALSRSAIDVPFALPPLP